MISSLDASVRQCAQASIAGTLSIIGLRTTDYRTRAAALDARLERSEAVVATKFSQLAGTRSVEQLTLAISSLEAAVAGVSALVKTSFGAFATSVKALPDLLVGFVSQSGMQFPADPSPATVCRYVDTALRPHLQTISGDMDRARAAIDLRIADLDERIQKLETILRG